MEGRVCLRVRIPYALSALKNWKCFSLELFCWIVGFFGCWIEVFVVFVQKRSVLACFGPRCLFLVLLQCQSVSRVGFGARLGWILVGAPRFFVLAVWKRDISEIGFPGRA